MTKRSSPLRQRDHVDPASLDRYNAGALRGSRSNATSTLESLGSAATQVTDPCPGNSSVNVRPKSSLLLTPLGTMSDEPMRRISRAGARSVLTKLAPRSSLRKTPGLTFPIGCALAKTSVAPSNTMASTSGLPTFHCHSCDQFAPASPERHNPPRYAYQVRPSPAEYGTASGAPRISDQVEPESLDRRTEKPVLVNTVPGIDGSNVTLGTTPERTSSGSSVEWNRWRPRSDVPYM